MGLRQATSSHYHIREAARQATLGDVWRRYGIAS
jgi:hypothetical protein